jgi:hypothetical protein
MNRGLFLCVSDRCVIGAWKEKEGKATHDNFIGRHDDCWESVGVCWMERRGGIR